MLWGKIESGKQAGQEVKATDKTYTKRKCRTMRLESYGNALEKNPLFSGMTSEQRGRAAALLCGRIQTYEKGAFLHPAGERFHRFGLVLSGGVQACCDDLDGNRMIMAEVQPGVTFGESLCYLQVESPSVYICATEPSVILWMSPERLFGSDTEPDIPELRRRFAALLAQRTLAMNDRILILSKLSIREKLLVYFQRLAREAGTEAFTVPMNRDDMATYIGANRAALSRELSRMKAEGLIDYRKNRFCLLRK